MTDDKNFLARWSRRKQEAVDAKDVSPEDSAPTDQQRIPVAPQEAAAEPMPSQDKPEEPFDLASLPSLESITAETDIRGFLQPGVPADLARAALRRAWAADPAIRNHVGLAEYAWDFTDPESMPGFGPLGPGVNVKALVADVFGEARPIAEGLPTNANAENPVASLQSVRTSELPMQTPSPPATPDVTSGTDDKPAASPEIAASQHEARDTNDARDTGGSEPPNRRRHGSALPHQSPEIVRRS